MLKNPSLATVPLLQIYMMIKCGIYLLWNAVFSLWLLDDVWIHGHLCDGRPVYYYTVKKVIVFPVPSRDITNQTLSDGNNIIIPAQGEFG